MVRPAVGLALLLMAAPLHAQPKEGGQRPADEEVGDGSEEGGAKGEGADGVANASDPVALVQRARRALEELRYEDALRLSRAVAPDAPGPLRMAAFEIRGIVHLIQGDGALAQPLLAELYANAPAFLLDDPSLPPRVTRMFDEEANRPHARAVTPQIKPRGDDLRAFTLVAGGETAEVALFCRTKRDGPPTQVQTRFEAGQADFRLPASGRFYCHALAVDAEGLPLGRLGTPDAPAIIASRMPPSPLPPPVTEKWWFWTSIGGGVVVAGGAIAAAVLLSQRTDAPAAELDVTLSAQGLAPLVTW